MMEIGVPVGAGTDATRVSSYNPYLSLVLAYHRKERRGLSLYPQENRLDREEALKLYTVGSSWFSTEERQKRSACSWPAGRLGGSLWRLFFSIPEEEIKHLESVLTSWVGRSSMPATNSQDSRRLRCRLAQAGLLSKKYGGYAKR